MFIFVFAFVFAPLLFARPALAVETIAKAAILVEMDTGAVLFEKNADELLTPASMSKMMTIYMIFDRLRNGSLSLDDTFPVSERAWRNGGARSGSSTMFLEPGQRVRVEDLIQGIIVQSGNDAAIVVAEGLASSEAAFAEEMTAKAREIGLEKSTFKNATGWPVEGHLMTARDLAQLARRTIKDFPDYYRFYAEKEFTYNGIRQTNRNPLLYKNMGADGMKTGHTQTFGYSLTSTAVRGSRRLILVVMGLPSKMARGKESERLLEWGFREFNNYALFKAGEEVTKADVWLGQKPSVPLLIEKDLTITWPRKARRKMKVTVSYTGPIAAPVAKGAVVAKLTITAPGQKTIQVPLVAGEGVPLLGLVGRLGAALNFILWGESG